MLFVVFGDPLFRWCHLDQYNQGIYWSELPPFGWPAPSLAGAVFSGGGALEPFLKPFVGVRAVTGCREAAANSVYRINHIKKRTANVAKATKNVVKAL